MNKAQRETIAKGFTDIAARFSATVERRDEPRSAGYGASITLRIALNGVGALLSIDDLHGGEGALISWHNAQEPGEWDERFQRLGYGVRYFTPGFVTCVGDYTGKRRAHKATTCATWEVMQAHLQAGLRKAANGVAFIPDEELTA